jgi:lysophospholipase L1-like esterase
MSAISLLAIAATVVLPGASSVANANTAELHEAPDSSFHGAYVALGDSYTAGPLIPDDISGSGACLRSDHDYPSLVGEAIQPSGFADVSCSGAVTSDMTSAQGSNPPQFDALGRGDRLVTLGIGGNDIGFVGIALTCLALSVLDSTGAPCEAHYTSGGTDQVAAAIAQTAPKIATVLQGIRQRAPRARVLVIGYPDILPASASDCAPGVSIPLAAGDIPWLNSEEQALDRMLATQAAASGATYVDTYASSIGHDACQAPGTRWIEGVVNVQGAAPIHPNELGMQNDARQILAALIR